MENFALALSRFRRNKYDQCIVLCDEILKQHPNDLAVQLLKTHAIRKKNYIDDVLKIKKNIPSPNLYQIKEDYRPLSGKMSKGARKTLV